MPVAEPPIAGNLIRGIGIYRLLFLASLILTGLFGCNRADTPAGQPKNGRELLERMADAYRQAKTYADAGELRWHFVLGGQVHDEVHNFSVSLERPNKLRLQVYEANIVCDGSKFWASMDTLANQVLERPAPAVLESKHVYGDLDYRHGDPALGRAIAQGVASGSLQLALLLDNNPLAKILEGADSPELLAPQTIDGHPCRGVKVMLSDGQLVFWIDQATYELRRAEYPVIGLERELKRMGVTHDVSLTAEFKGAILNGPIDPQAFRFETPKSARVVTRFEAVERPVPPSALLGRKITDFHFTTLDGKQVTLESVRGKVVVLDFWATWCQPCLQSLPNLDLVDGRYKGNEKVAIFAVSIDTPPAKSSTTNPVSTDTPSTDAGVSNDEIQAVFHRGKWNISILRDLDQQARSVFGVENIPNMFILGPDGTVEDNEVGLNPELATDLPQRIDKLLTGQSIKDDALRRYDARMRQYETQFQTPEGAEPAMQRAAIAPESQPVTLKLLRRWTNNSLKEPGNVLTFLDAASPKVLVHDGWSKVVELSVDGRVVTERPLTLPNRFGTDVVTYLRTATDGAGARWFVGSASTMPQVHVFDSNWNRVLSYPDEKSAGGIADVQLGDLDGDGKLELNVGYYDVVGVQNVLLDGHRRWGVRSIANVYRVAVTDADATGRRGLLCANERGTIVPINAQGQELPHVQVGNRFVRAVYAQDLNGDGLQEWLAIASTGPGLDTLVGLDRSGRETWNYALPVGLQGHPALEMVTSGKLVGDEAQWVVAGADGSVHLLSAEGTPIDRFNHGAAIAGIAVVPGDKPLLVISHAAGVDAWEVVK